MQQELLEATGLMGRLARLERQVLLESVERPEPLGRQALTVLPGLLALEHPELRELMDLPELLALEHPGQRGLTDHPERQGRRESVERLEHLGQQALMVPLELLGSGQAVQQVLQVVTVHLERAELQALMGRLAHQELLEQPELVEHLELQARQELMEHPGLRAQRECGAGRLILSVQPSPTRTLATGSYDTTTPP